MPFACSSGPQSPPGKGRPVGQGSALQVLVDTLSDCAALLLYEKERAMPERSLVEPMEAWRLDEIRKLNESLERRASERGADLEAAFDELAVFDASVSRDLHAPLRQVDCFLDILAQSLGPEGREAAHCLGRAKAASRRMGQFIDALLQFSRLGRQSLALGPVELDEVLARVLEAFAPAAAGRRVSWLVEPLPVIQGDAALIRMAFQNLIGNALKFTEPRERAEIQVGRRPGRPGELVVFVRDNGVGFDPAYAGLLFGVFQRLHPSDPLEGMGIGLANVQRIIQRHGGRVWAEGQPDRGATFYLTLPLEGLSRTGRPGGRPCAGPE